ncbi:MAG: RNA polymerase sigma factor [Crocinitomicaceae bacterium]|nr:RNA polymerase sigma factor [Flavobacteriales bacterium]NQZ35512.1 RNA polymerase sigma factor [Crocinitomicaceae bacterium]
MGLFRKDIASFSDEELMVLLASKRRNEALTELHSRYAKRILGFFIRMFKGDQAKAQDFTQDIFLKVLEKHAQFNPERKFYTWMYVIASNMCKTEFRKLPDLQIPENETMLSIGAKWNENIADKMLFQSELKKSIEQLEEYHQATFVLRYMQELSIKEIAVITEVSEGTVKSRLFYATKKITAKLELFNPTNENDLFKIQ